VERFRGAAGHLERALSHNRSDAEAWRIRGAAHFSLVQVLGRRGVEAEREARVALESFRESARLIPAGEAIFGEKLRALEKYLEGRGGE